MKKKKTLIITSIVIMSIIFLGIIFACLDYNLATKGMKPLFSRESHSVIEYNAVIAGDNETKQNEEETTIYYSGLGYKLVTCTNCKNKVKMFLFTENAQKYYYDDLKCRLNHQEFLYIFNESILTNTQIMETIPTKDIEDIDILEEVLELNNIHNCGSNFNKQKNSNDFETYKITKYCDINPDLDKDTLKEFLLKSEYLTLSKKEIIKNLKKDYPKLLCE